MTVGCYLVNHFCYVCNAMATFENGSCCFCKKRIRTQAKLAKQIEFESLSTDKKLNYLFNAINNNR